MKKALITGITGQDGSYLSDFLIRKGYLVFGIDRRKSFYNHDRLAEIKGKIQIIDGDLTDQGSLERAIDLTQPDEIYNLGAMSFVATSFSQPELTTEVNALGVLKLLEAIRRINKNIKFYQASTSELYGKVHSSPQNEKTPFYPRSPYGVSKLYAHWIGINYRENYNMFISNGILFNHESPRRGIEFVTRKITNTLAKIKYNQTERLTLGNLDAKRDWGFAGDYVEAMWLMLKKEKPSDYVIATGKTHTVREFVEKAAEAADFNLIWRGKGLHEKGIDQKTGKAIIEISEKYFRPSEVETLTGDASKARVELGWKPKTRFDDLVKMMVEEDLKTISKK